jgi:glycosyltransferase involved in cell wall biosynthesis
MRAWNGLQDRTGVPWPIWSPGSVVKLWGLVGQADVVHLHDCLYMSNVLAYLFAKLRGKPVLLTQHISMVPYKLALLRFMMRTAYDIFGRLLLGGAERLVFYSKAVYGDFSARYSMRATPEFIANGVDTARFAPVPEAERDALRSTLYGVNREQVVLLFVGRFVEKKGLPIIRRLAEALPELPIYMLGVGPLEPEGWGLPNVHVKRGLDNAAVADYYKSADLLILPSIGEGLPLVMQEAMSCGLPVLVSSRTAHADPVASGVVFHEPALDELDEEAVVSRWLGRIQALAGDREARMAHGTALRETVLRHWTWSACAEKYAAVLESMVEEQSA